MSSIKLEWKRAKVDETTCANRRTWASMCGLYKVQESVGKFSGMRTIYYALFDGTIIGSHRTKGAAEKTCKKHILDHSK